MIVQTPFKGKDHYAVDRLLLAQWTRPVFAPAGRNQFHAAGELRSSDATRRHNHRGRLLSFTQIQRTAA